MIFVLSKKEKNMLWFSVVAVIAVVVSYLILFAEAECEEDGEDVEGGKISHFWKFKIIEENLKMKTNTFWYLLNSYCKLVEEGNTSE